MLVRTEQLVLGAGRFAVYPSGFEFTVWLIALAGAPIEHFDLPMAWAAPSRDAGAAVPPDVFRLELEFSDGSRATTLDAPRLREQSQQRPSPPVLWPRSGMRGDGRSEQLFWVWPLPPDGPLALHCQWPANDISAATVKLDAGLILEAAQHARSLLA